MFLCCQLEQTVQTKIKPKSIYINGGIIRQWNMNNIHVVPYFAFNNYTYESVFPLIKAQPHIPVLWHPVNYGLRFMFMLLNIRVWLHRLNPDVWWALLLMRSTSIPHGTMAHTLRALCLWYQTRHILFHSGDAIASCKFARAHFANMVKLSSQHELVIICPMKSGARKNLSFPNCNGCSVEFCECRRNFTLIFIMNVITSL